MPSWQLCCCVPQRTDKSCLQGPPVLHVSDLTVRYPSARSAVERVSFSLAEGEIVGISGESGCGKTTIALSILGLLPADAEVSGSIRFRGRELLGLPEWELQQIRGAAISIIFQESALALNPVMRVGDQIAEVIRAHTQCGASDARRQALALIGEVGLAECGSRIYAAYPHQLSGGQRQRILIAQALACRPALVIADEPTASLDATVRADILRLIKTLNRRLGISVLLISHSAAVLSAMADRVLLMAAGRMIAPGSAPVLPSLPRALRSIPAARSGIAVPKRETPSLVRVNGLTKHYAQHRFLSRQRFAVPAFAGVDLTVGPGTTLGLVGESGSGKSTLARCLACLEQVDVGEIWFGDREIGRLRDRELRPYRRRIQLVFQESASALNPRLDAQEIVAEPLVIQREGTRADRRGRALELMTQVGFPLDRVYARPHELSGGERQRLAIARALAAGASVLILDEALAGLDVSRRTQILNLLLELQTKHGLTYVCISHDLGVLAHFASDIAVMHEGRIVERGPAFTLLHAPRHPRTRALVAAATVASPAAVAAAG